ncbi:MAG: hypothetical protein JRJ65_19645 [Deltaproteobacteria bacterium]|nr:hypothetical protein [Deltaproteobacteria bacterium]
MDIETGRGLRLRTRLCVIGASTTPGTASNSGERLAFLYPPTIAKRTKGG